MVKSIHNYMRSAGIGAAIPNVIINPALAWLMNREMKFVPLNGDGSLLMDTAITSIILTILVTLFIVAGIHKNLKNGNVNIPKDHPDSIDLLASFPQQGWALGLLLGIIAALVITPMTFAFFVLLDLNGLPFMQFAMFKAVYTPVLAFFVVRWVVLRQIHGDLD